MLALPTLLMSVDMSVLYLALPHLATDLEPSSTQMLWIMDIYAFMIAGFLITMGTLGDRIGRRRLLLIGAVAFGAASVLAAYSTSAGMLIAARTVLGIAGATLMPSTLALISNMFTDSKQRAVAIAVWMSCFMGGAALGPVVGGLMLQWFWWGSVFLLGVPIMVTLLIAAPVLLPEYRNPEAGRLDLFSVALSLGAILPFVYGLKELAKDGVGAMALVTLAVGAAVGVVFVRRQFRLDDPLLDLRLFRSSVFSTALGAVMVSTLAMGGMFMLVSQYLQLVAGLSPLDAGLLLVPPSVAMIGSTILAPALAQRFGRAVVIGGGMLAAAAGFALLTQVGASGDLPLVVIGQSIAATGLGPGAALLTGIIIGSAPKEKAGSAAAVSETSGELGMGLGVALLGSITTAVYRRQLTVPDGISDTAASAARDTLASADAAVQEMSAQAAARLLDPARDAFTQGMSTAVGVGAAATAVFGVLAILLLRNVSAAPDPHADETPEPVG